MSCSKIFFCTVAIFAATFSFVNDSSAADPVFHYSFDSSTSLPTITDQSSAGNNALAGEIAALSTDIPTVGVPAGSGDRSFDSSDLTATIDFQAGASTDNILLLSNDQLETAGGFTYETWFKWNGAGSVNSIIDYAGTDKLIIDQRFGATTLLQMRLDGCCDLDIGEIVAGEWNYVAFTMDTTGNSVTVDGTIDGIATAYLNGVTPIDLGPITKGSFGDELQRPIGIGQHPIGFDLDYFDGLVYEPRVSLGVVPVEDLLFEGTVGVDGDFDDDGDYDCVDIDALVAAIAAGQTDTAFDLTGDGFYDMTDIDAWLAEAGANNLASGNPYLIGDANLDGTVDVSDFNVWNGNKFTNVAAWCSGDFNADGVVDVSDFNAWNGNKFQTSDAVAMVPEPSGLLMTMVMLAIPGILRRRRQ